MKRCCVVLHALFAQVMDVLHMNDDVVHEGLMATLHDSGWPNFPGVQSYVLKVSMECKTVLQVQYVAWAEF